MEQQSQPEWELTIDPDTVRLFILKARAIGAELRDDYEAGHEREIWVDDNARNSHHNDALNEEQSRDLTGRELRALIADLNVDERAELIAIMLIGRGDFDRGEWDDALAEARSRNLGRISSYLMGMPMLGDWLEAGLDAIGA